MYSNYIKFFSVIMLIAILFAGCEQIVLQKPTVNPVSMTPSEKDVSSAQSVSAPFNPSSPGNGYLAKDFASLFAIAGSFDNLKVTLPIGTKFTLINGDLGPTGTFTTTTELEATLSAGLQGTTQIVNGTLSLIGTVTGTYNYLGTDYTDGTLLTDDTTTITLEGVYATGTIDLSTATFNAQGSPTGNVFNDMVITLPTITNLAGSFVIAGGTTYDGTVFTITSPNVPAEPSSGNLNSGGTQYDNASLSITLNCIDGTVTGAAANINAFTILITQATIAGTTTAGTNGIQFDGTNITTGQFNNGADQVSAGSCP